METGKSFTVELNLAGISRCVGPISMWSVRSLPTYPSLRDAVPTARLYAPSNGVQTASLPSPCQTRKPLPVPKALKTEMHIHTCIHTVLAYRGVSLGKTMVRSRLGNKRPALVMDGKLEIQRMTAWLLLVADAWAF